MPGVAVGVQVALTLPGGLRGSRPASVSLSFLTCKLRGPGGWSWGPSHHFAGGSMACGPWGGRKPLLLTFFNREVF